MAIYLHGGISAKYASTTIREIKEAIAAELNDLSKIKRRRHCDGARMARSGTGSGAGEGAAIVEHVDKALQAPTV